MTTRILRSPTILWILLVAAVAVGGELLVAGSAVAQPSVVQDPVPIGPHEPFIGFVNGASSNAIIRMGCFGAVRPGQKGHPLAGQTTEVQLGPSLSGPGLTGKADAIVAVLSYPSPSATPVAIVLAKFRNYYVPAPISTSLSIPCAGSGSVTFVPVNGGTTARMDVVKISFVGQP